MERLKLLRRQISDFIFGGDKSAEVIRFLFVGTSNTVFSYLIYLTGLWLGATPVWAYSASYLAGLVFTYFLNLKVTFRQRHHWRKMLLYPLVYAAQYAIGLVALQFFISLGVAAEFAGLLILPLTVPLGFVLSRLFLR